MTDKLTAEQLINLYYGDVDSRATLAAQLTSETAHHLLETARLNKIFPEIYEALQPHFTLEEEHHLFYQRYRNMREEIFRILNGMGVDGAGLDFLVLKGPGIEAYYPPGKSRYFHDLDVAVSSLDEFWKTGHVLLENELDQFSTMTMFTEPDTGLTHGGARFDPVEETLEFEGVEVQIGAYSMNMRTYLPWETFTRGRRQVRLADVTVPVPDREGNLLIYLAELMSRTKLMLRDLFDVTCVTQPHDISLADEIDLDYVAQVIERYHLHYALRLLLHSYEETPVLETPPMLLELAGRVGVQPTLPPFEELRRFHILPYLRRNTSSPLRNYWYHNLRETTTRWNDTDRWLTLMKAADLRFGAKPFFQNGAYVYFMKLNAMQHEGAWKWLKVDRYDVVLTPIGSFVVCCHALYGDEELDELAGELEQMYG
ncbi:nucleotidyltransferase family protein [Tumebacillus sp. ITR2]|uniref:Nucleotidyltransferase family protein n=1 Tax=Tumebacillus amylolyticus TaxID=2801339 RepID=A0ABS1JEN6_9BACL|nr:nucleotidyltransferase family protein [Tumebacillus amylolyticus]MBL0388746.1 nucleotidyltransferase family protein [Tumebacillus amylolyticus]